MALLRVGLVHYPSLSASRDVKHTEAEEAPGWGLPLPCLFPRPRLLSSLFLSGSLKAGAKGLGQHCVRSALVSCCRGSSLRDCSSESFRSSLSSFRLRCSAYRVESEWVWVVKVLIIIPTLVEMIVDPLWNPFACSYSTCIQIVRTRLMNSFTWI